MSSPMFKALFTFLALFGCVGIPFAEAHGMREGVSSVSFSPGSTFVAFSFGKKGRPVEIVDTYAGKIVRVLRLDKGDATDLDFSPSGSLLAASITRSVEPTDGRIIVWKTQTGEVVSTLKTPALYFVRFGSENLLYFDYFDELHSWGMIGSDTKTGRRWDQMTQSADLPDSSLAISLEGDFRAECRKQEDSTVVVTSNKTGIEVARLPLPGRVVKIFFSDRGDKLCVLSKGKPSTIQIFETRSWKPGPTLPAESQPISGAFSRDSRLLAVHFNDITLRVFDLGTLSTISSTFLLPPQEALIEAADVGAITVVTNMLFQGVSADTREATSGETALMIAASGGFEDIEAALTKAGADVNAIDYHRWTALMHASLQGQVSSVKFLLAAKADVSARNSDGKTALAEAEYGRSLDEYFGHGRRHDVFVQVIQTLQAAGAQE